MANLIREHRIIDSNKRALLKYVLVSDGTAAANVTLVDASTLRFALNTAGKIMSANTDPKDSYGLNIKRIFGLGHLATGYVKVQWGSAANSEIIVFDKGSFDFDFESMGDGAVLSCPDANATGDIVFSTSGLASGDTFTLFIDARKNPSDFDQGQTADPYAFNRGQ